MKAIIHERYGLPQVLDLREVEKPVPSPEEVLVKVLASSVNPAEWYGMKGLWIGRLGMGMGFLRPKNTRLGADFAGIVEQVGANVTDFKAGDEIFGGRTGAFAEYVCVRNAIALKPKNISFAQAAAVPTAGITALQGLRDYAQVRPGSRVLINGASGGVGTFSVQIAKALGAKVTGVCTTHNVELVRSLGADHVVDYTQEDFTRSGNRYDVLFDIAGSHSWSDYKRVLTRDAILVVVGAKSKNRLIGPLAHVINLKLAMLRASQKMAFFIAQFNRPDMAILGEMIAAGKVTPVIDRQYDLGEIREAMSYLGTGHARAKIVVTMDGKRKS
jgi:NADPH:quinone reductase-like Zn-dependent oxidoreductase